MIFESRIWLTFCCLFGTIKGYCLYGDTPDCAFQCHCAVDSECSEGVCPSGCDKGPLGYDWGGPACQIGDVGLNKPANMTGVGSYPILFPATAALDGVSPGSLSTKCAHPATSNSDPAEWWTDLEDVYKIYNITIYGRTDKYEERLQQFDLTVYNSSDNEVLCGSHSDIIYTYSTITCNESAIGRYVHFKRTGGPDIDKTALCEVIIIGHKYIDCLHCPVGVTCNDVTGCAQCNGFYPPDCTQKCESGYYGTNCQQQCGYCKDGVTCDNQNGICHNGCQLWWIDNRCQTYITKPNGSKNNVSARTITSNCIEIEWPNLAGICDMLEQYYGYLVEYKDDTTGEDYAEAATINYTSLPYWKIENLKSNTSYSIQIKPYRTMDNNIEYGSAYPVLQVITSCEVSKFPTFKVEFSGVLVENIKVEYEYQVQCEQLTLAFIEYRLKGTERWFKEVCDLCTVTCILPPILSGTYELRVTVQDNGDGGNSSDVKFIEIQARKAFTPYYITATVSIILLGIITALAVLLWKARMRHSNANDGKNKGHKTLVDIILQ